eukprot:1939605-Prymnesium_polylepis.1
MNEADTRGAQQCATTNSIEAARRDITNVVVIRTQGDNEPCMHAGRRATWVGGTGWLPTRPLNDTYPVPEAPQSR